MRGLAGVERARLPGEGSARAAGMPLGSVWALGRGPCLLLPGPALLGGGLIVLAVWSPVPTHGSDRPRCAAGGLLLRSSSHGKEMSARTLSTPRREQLPRSRAIYRISKVSHQPRLIPRPGPPKGREIFPRTPPSQLCSWDFWAEATKEKRQSGQWVPPPLPRSGSLHKTGMQQAWDQLMGRTGPQPGLR